VLKLKPEERLAALDAVCNALAHPARRQILLTMKFRGGSMTAGAITARFGHAWPTTTRHLRVLEAAGLVSFQKRGRQRVYKLELKRLSMINDWLRWFDSTKSDGNEEK
jgi:DNA-binding transcriptional ArsR family regulator